MKNLYILFLFTLLFSISGSAQGLLQPFMDDVENHADWSDDFIGWTSLDLDGVATANPTFNEFPGRGTALGFIVYNPTQTSPVNTLDGFPAYSGNKYFVSISNWYDPVNDWLISDELAPHPGGTFSFYAKSSATYSGPDAFKVGYSTTTDAPADFIFFNNGNSQAPTGNWVKYEYVIPANAKHLAINGVSQAVMLMIDNLKFEPTIDPMAPGIITDFVATPEIGAEIQATFTWVNPEVDQAGNALATMTGVKVYRGTHPMNLIEVADLPAAVGETESYSDILPEGGSYTHRFVPYNDAGNGIAYNTPLTFFGYETIPGAPHNITFAIDASGHNVISWDVVDYGAGGGTLEDPVVGYTLTRSLGTTTETLATMHPSTSFTETDIPDLNLFEYTITAQTSAVNLGVPAVVSAYSGMNANQVSVTSGNVASDQVFELNRASIITQSIYTPNEIGASGLITSLSYFGDLGSATTAHYKIYMSLTDREMFGTTVDNAVWEYFGDQELLFDGNIEFQAGREAITIQLDQPFYYDDTNGDNLIITIVKPLLDNPPSFYPRDFYNTTVDGMRTYYAVGHVVDLSLISVQPAGWSTEDVATIPSVVFEKMSDYGSLAGVVTMLGDGSPLENVTVSITPEGAETFQTATATTDATGAYHIPALMPGTYLVTFTKDAFNTFETSITIAVDEELTLDAVLDNSVAIVISGTVVNVAGDGVEGVNLNLTGFSNYTTTTDATGNFTLEAFSEKVYSLAVDHPLYIAQSMSFTSEESDYTLDPIVLVLAPHKPVNVVAVNNDGVGEINWDVPVGLYNETMLGWGGFITAGDAWGNGGSPFIAGIRFETSDLEEQVIEDAKLTHVRAYIANNAQIVIKVFEGANAAQLIHSQPASIQQEGWYVFELTESLPIDVTKELWIGIEFFAGQYGAYPIGLDDGPNAPAKKGSMKYENGAWAQMSLTNKNWNIYGIANNTMEANPSGYKVYRSPASANTWTELTTASVTQTSFDDTSLANAEPDMYKYGVSADYENDILSDKAISNEIEHNLLFDFTVAVEADFGNAEGAYVSVWNGSNFAEAFVPASATSVTFPNLMHGDYNVRVELDNYEIVELSNVPVDLSSTSVTVPLALLKVQPSNLTATTIEGASSVTLDWTLHTAFTDQIEKYQDFAGGVSIGDYILKDLDGLETSTYINFSWPNAGAPMSFMVFNPFTATPPVTTLPAFSGRRFLAAVAGPDGANNDWLIIPAGAGEFSFMAGSFVNASPEIIRVLYSTTGTDVSDFTVLENELAVPGPWTSYSFDAPVGTKYVAINYVGNDTYILKLDNLTYEKEYHHELSYNVYLDGVVVAENLTETSFVLADIPAGYHLAEVEAVYETGASIKTEIELGTVGIQNHKKAEFGMYPNPATGRFTLELNTKAIVNVIDIHGRVLHTEVKEAGTSIIELNLASGTYIIQVQIAEGTASKKLILL